MITPNSNSQTTIFSTWGFQAGVVVYFGLELELELELDLDCIIGFILGHFIASISPSTYLPTSPSTLHSRAPPGGTCAIIHLSFYLSIYLSFFLALPYLTLPYFMYVYM